MSDKELLENALKSIEIQESLTNEQISERALVQIRNQKKILPSKFLFFRNTDKKIIFMAGSPGAGKTEIAEQLKDKLQIDSIDTDEIRKIFNDYNGKNAFLFQKASSKGVSILVDYALSQGFSFILDGNFSEYDLQKQNIERALKRGFSLEIHFVYRDFDVAKEYTKNREMKTGRNVPNHVFCNKTIGAYETVKKFFGKIPIHFYDLDNVNISYDISKEKFTSLLEQKVHELVKLEPLSYSPSKHKNIDLEKP